MNLISLFDTLDRCVPFKVRRSLPWLRVTEVLAVVLTDAEGDLREGIELAICAFTILAAALWIVSHMLPLV